MRTLGSALMVVICAAYAGPVHALTYSTPEGSTAAAIASWSKIYSLEHADALPTDWSDFRGILEEPLEHVMPHAAPVKRYAFLSPPIELAQPHFGELFAINRSDIFDSTLEYGFWGLHSGFKGPGRYAIYRTQKNEFLSVWVSADYVKSLFENNQRKLPAADNEPERVWVTRTRNAVVMQIAGYGAAICLLILFSLWKSGLIFRRHA